jgi:hypothetical protein
VSVNVTNDVGEVIAARLKKLLIMTRTCGVTRLERNEMKINLSKQFLMGLNKWPTTKLSGKKLNRSINLRAFSVPTSSFGISFITVRDGKFSGINVPDNEEVPDTLSSCHVRKRYCRHFQSISSASILKS